jgi:hypothetical protein
LLRATLHLEAMEDAESSPLRHPHVNSARGGRHPASCAGRRGLYSASSIARRCQVARSKTGI